MYDNEEKNGTEKKKNKPVNSEYIVEISIIALNNYRSFAAF